MKKVKWLFFATAIASLSFFTSCKEDEKDEPTPAVEELKTVDAVLVYAPLSDKSSKTFVKKDGTTVTVEAFKTEGADINLGYFYGKEGKATLSSPANYLTTAYDLSSNEYKDYTKNATTLATPKSDVKFDEVKTKAELEKAYTEGTVSTDKANEKTGQRIDNLQAGNLVAYKAADGSYGLVKVVEVKGEANNGDYIKLSIKIVK